MFTIEILVAEDEETDAFFIQEAFGQTEHPTHVTVVPDGEHVVDFVKKQNGYESAPTPHIIFLDIQMPKKDGHETLKEIKALPECAKIPIIMMSSSLADEDIKKSQAYGANAHVAKSKGFNDMLDFIKCVENFWFKRVLIPHYTDTGV